MIKEQLYKKTTDILFNAYFNDTLRHNMCTACAVGNIVAANMGYEVCKSLTPISERPTIDWRKDGEHIPFNWSQVFITPSADIIQYLHPENYIDEAKKEIDSTGYSVNELARIEYAFETAPKGKNDEDYMYNGLVAVIDVLNDIHQVDIDVEKERFTQHYNKKVLVS